MLLAAVILLPLLAAAAVVFAGDDRARTVALAAAVAEAALSLVLAARVASGPLTAGLGAGSYLRLAADGLSAPLVALTGVLGVAAALASWRITRPAAHHALLLVLVGAVQAVFLAADLVLFYVAWESVLVPMYFLIGKWGHEDRRHAAMKFFVYTFAGSVFMLVGLLVVLGSGGGWPVAGVRAAVPASLQTAVFWLLAAGFLVKVPAVPFHTWLPDAHVEAPTAGSILLAGVLLKMGAYGLLRLAGPLAPVAYRQAGPVLVFLGVVGVLYGGAMALAQSDAKRLVAYSSVAHMGVVLAACGIGTAAAAGAAILGMVSHGLVAAMLFLLVGLVGERTGTRDLARLGGLFRPMPRWGTAFAFAALAGLGLPGLSAFPGELVTVMETYRVSAVAGVAVVAGLVLAAAYNLRAVRRLGQGEVPEAFAATPDLSRAEGAAAALLAVGVLALGLWPAGVLALADPFARSLSSALGGG